METRDMAGLAADCPAVEDECEDPQQPDPPEVPDPPEPVCGDRKVEQPWEECDCGLDYRDCQVIHPETIQCITINGPSKTLLSVCRTRAATPPPSQQRTCQ